MRKLSGLVAAIAVTWSVATGFAQSKPAVGTEAKAFKAFGVTGQFDGKEVELAAAPVAHGQLYLFVAADRFDRPVARYIKTFDDHLLKGIEGVKALDVYAIWLTADPQQSKDYLPKAQQSLRLGQTSLAVFEGAKQGPDGWALDADAHLTAVLVRNGKIAASLAYGSTNETDVPALIEAVKQHAADTPPQK
jgi:hypothetical protein